MKIITFLSCLLLVTSLAFFVGCEAHSLTETKALHHHDHHSDDEHDDNHHGDEHAKDADDSDGTEVKH